MLNPAEKIIEEWMAQTPSENLPGKGRPLDLDEYFRWPEDYRLAYSLLKNAGYVPEEVEQLREIGRLKEQISQSTDDGLIKGLKSRLAQEQVSLNIRLEKRRHQRKS
ncbi:MAG: DUF1992 domain-containing protein [Chthoniobacterales bacterium]